MVREADEDGDPLQLICEDDDKQMISLTDEFFITTFFPLCLKKKMMKIVQIIINEKD